MDYKALSEWLLSGKTGASSEALAAHLGGVGKKSGNYPHDHGDFMRCEGLLDAVPELRGRLHEMATVNKYWAALVPVWEDIRSARDDKKYALIQRAIRPVENGDANLVRLGPGVTMRIGEL